MQHATKLAVVFAIAGLFAGHAGAQEPGAGHVRVRETVVFDGNRGWEDRGITYRLACGACVAQMPNGDLLCWWLSGSGHEPSTDNNVLASRSTDRGASWGEPYVLVQAGEEARAYASNCAEAKDFMILSFLAVFLLFDHDAYYG